MSWVSRLSELQAGVLLHLSPPSHPAPAAKAQLGWRLSSAQGMGLLLTGVSSTTLESPSKAAPNKRARGSSVREGVCWAARKSRWAGLGKELSLGAQSPSVDCRWNKKQRQLAPSALWAKIVQFYQGSLWGLFQYLTPIHPS